ncbi:hypothetical protein L596_014355 [Steinernema carpocapsae]|uniref:Uncharacterized protein n=1 Tax=Steinernema carpocapsae TaxID=34508 RepID=A0A4U5NCL9_STECR|nr:hypothetical protein L596_014355 [Steinernema carpocapsae]
MEKSQQPNRPEMSLITRKLKNLFSSGTSGERMQGNVSIYVLRYMNRKKVCLVANLSHIEAGGKRIEANSRAQSISMLEKVAKKRLLEVLKIDVFADSNRYEEEGLKFDHPLLERLFKLTTKAKKTTIAFQKAKIYSSDPLEEFFPIVKEDDSMDVFLNSQDLAGARFDEIVFSGDFVMKPETFHKIAARSKNIFFRNFKAPIEELSGQLKTLWQKSQTQWLQYPSTDLFSWAIDSWTARPFPPTSRRLTSLLSSSGDLSSTFDQSNFEELLGKCRQIDFNVAPLQGASTEPSLAQWLQFLNHLTQGKLDIYVRRHSSNSNRSLFLIEVPRIRDFPTFSDVVHLLFV